MDGVDDESLAGNRAIKNGYSSRRVRHSSSHMASGVSAACCARIDSRSSGSTSPRGSSRLLNFARPPPPILALNRPSARKFGVLAEYLAFRRPVDELMPSSIAAGAGAGPPRPVPRLGGRSTRGSLAGDVGGLMPGGPVSPPSTPPPPSTPRDDEPLVLTLWPARSPRRANDSSPRRAKDSSPRRAKDSSPRRAKDSWLSEVSCRRASKTLPRCVLAASCSRVTTDCWSTISVAERPAKHR